MTLDTDEIQVRHENGYHFDSPLPSRIVIDRVTPALEGGRFAAKNVAGKPFTVSAVIICDGHEILKANLLWRHEDEARFDRVPMSFEGNDCYQAAFVPDEPGFYIYSIEAAIDRYAGWKNSFLKKLEAGEAEAVDGAFGLRLMQDYADHPGHAGKDKHRTLKKIERLEAIFTRLPVLSPSREKELRTILEAPEVEAFMRENWSDPSAVRYHRELPLKVDPPCAVFSSWYEFFPRSRWKGIAEEGTLQDAAARLPYIADMGFDVVYLPPIHPIGRAYRKGRNNAIKAQNGDVGSPWAIGGKEGGHTAIDPALGTFKDFAALVKAARALNMKLALDIAFQCAPDHPWVKDHPSWFRKRADGSIQYAENPPKKYQDIYPLDFESEDWRALWEELKNVILFWAKKGVRIFRVDNPHTKSFAFWEWCIREISRDYPDTIFLAEAFTRPHVMAYLAKIGFNQSYTYFAWRHTKHEFEDYLTELTGTDLQYYFRPNFWPNTPDILTETLQSGERAAFAQRLILAATLSASYGIYGPPFELMESAPLVRGKEEYLHSEKYEVRTWDVSQPRSLAPLIKKVNAVRHANRALQSNDNLMFHPTDNDRLLAYTKLDGDNLILTVVNLDFRHPQSGMVDLQAHKLGLDPYRTYLLFDLLDGGRYQWQGWKNYVALNPQILPAHIFRIEQDEAQD